MLRAGLVEALRQDGHDVLYVAETLSGGTDRDVLHRAFEEARIQPTEDKDFGEPVYRLRHPARGVILLRFDEGEPDEKLLRLRVLFARWQDRLEGCFVVLERDKTRIRLLR